MGFSSRGFCNAMFLKRKIIFAVVVGLMALQAPAQMAQPAPANTSRPMRIVTGGTGGGNDFLSRILAQGLTSLRGQQVIVDNRPSGVIPGEIVMRSAPDGHTLVVYGSSFWTAPLLQETPFDPIRDFTPVTLAAFTPNVVVIHPALAATSMGELIALMKVKPGTFNYATSGTGSANHLAGELFKVMAGVNMVRINYKGPGQAISDLMAGQVQMMFATATAGLTQARAGKLRALAVTSLKPSALAPELPTVAAAGLAGYEAVSPYGIYGPARIPAALVNDLHRDILDILQRADSKTRLFAAGLEIVGSSPAQLTAAMKADQLKFGKIIKAAGIKIE
jgi:tripartite-type tricarboxylate transporter receptor subunit TctC